MPRHWSAVLAATLLSAGFALAGAQEAPPARPAEPSAAADASGDSDPAEPRATKAAEPRPERRGRTPSTPLRVKLVLSRFQGDEKIASLPYTFVVAADGLTQAKLRMGVDVPVPSKGPNGSASFHYRQVGTNVDCRARAREDGRYTLVMIIEHSSVSTHTASVPTFRKFDVTLEVILRDGESVQTIAATDPVSGEVVKADVTLQVLK